MSGRIGQAVRDGVIILAITLALLAVLELGFRLYSGPVAFLSDEEVIATLKPGISKVYLRFFDGPRYIRWSTNADGFRGSELLEDPSPRVIVYGDSNIQARFSVWEDSYTGQLQRLLRESLGDTAEVVNAGALGYGPDQSLLRLERELERYTPDVVVFHVFADNDFGDLIRNRLFELDDDGALVRTSFPFVEDPLLRSDWWNTSILERIKNLRVSIWPRELVQGQLRAWLPEPELQHDPETFREQYLARSRSEFEVYANGEPRSYSWMADNYDADIAFAPNAGSSQTKMALMAAILKHASDVANEASVRFVVLIQPSSRDVAKNLPNHYATLACFPEYDRRRMTRSLIEACQGAGIDCIDLYEHFTERGDANSLYFRLDDNHWNEAGQLLAAEVTATWILAEHTAR